MIHGFISRIREIIEIEKTVKSGGLPNNSEDMLLLKMYGFTDARNLKTSKIN